MSKIYFLADTHIMSTSPSTRNETAEEYRQLQYNKLKQVYDKATNDDIIVITGDVFHSSALSMMSGTPKFYNDIIDLMNSRPTYTIVGNHDLYYRNETVENTTILDNLFKTGVKHLEHLRFKDINLVGVDYGHDFPVFESSDTYNIVVAHSFFEDKFYGATGNFNLTIEGLKLMKNVNAVVLGHDHNTYKILDIDGVKIVRPGSLMRGTSHTCNINRIPQVAILDTETKEWTYEPLSNVPGEEVFKKKVILEKDLDINMTDIISNLNSYDKSSNIYKILHENEVSGKEAYGERYEAVLNIIKQYLDTFGIVGR